MRKVMVLVGAFALVAIATSCLKPFDFDNDDKADFVTVYPNGMWRDWEKPVADPPLWVSPEFVHVVPGNYDGDGTYDAAVIKANGDWVTDSTLGTINFPAPPQTVVATGNNHFFMLPVPADYDGDHHTDPAWYRDSDGTWFILGQAPIQFGHGPTRTTAVTGPPYPAANDFVDQDFPTPADYDGDGKADLSTYNPRSRVWTVRSSANGTVSTVTMPGDKTVNGWPVPGDYDGVHHAQRALYTSLGWWIEGQADAIPFVSAPTPGSYGESYPAVADYDGDGRLDLSYVSDTGSWRTRSSADPLSITTYSVAPLIDFNRERPVQFTAASFNMVASFTYIAHNCRPPYGVYDC